MKNAPYLLRLEICGIKNIEKPVVLSFYKKTIENDFNPADYRVKAIFGENGSGKTALIQAVKILRSILLDENYLYDSETQRFLVETVNKNTKVGYIECEFIITGDSSHICNYHVDFAVKDDRRFYIYHERYMTKNGKYSKNKYNTIFETKQGELVAYGTGDSIDSFKRATQNLLGQRSFLTFAFNESLVDVRSVGREFSYFSLIYLLLFALSVNVYLDEEDNHINYFIKKRIEEIDIDDLSSEKISYIKQASEQILSSYFDTRIVPKDSFSGFQKRVGNMSSFLKIFKPDLEGIEIEKKETPDYYKCELILVYENYRIDQELESKGIKKLIKLFNYLNAASNGMIVFVDELDSSINDIYLDKLIEFFMYYAEGQLCFTSHNLSPMNILNDNKCSISFISGINTIHTWTRNGNESPERAYRNGFIADSPFNVDATDFIGILGGTNEATDSNMRGNQ